MTFFDAADVHSAGSSEEVTGRLLSKQFAKARHIAETNGRTKFVPMQNHYSKRFTSCGRSTLAA